MERLIPVQKKRGGALSPRLLKEVWLTAAERGFLAPKPAKHGGRGGVQHPEMPAGARWLLPSQSALFPLALRPPSQPHRSEAHMIVSGLGTKQQPETSWNLPLVRRERKPAAAFPESLSLPLLTPHSQPNPAQFAKPCGSPSPNSIPSFLQDSAPVSPPNRECS